MGQHTPLYSSHLKAGGRLVDFAGWDMPLHYGSQLREHHAVRTQAGVFDVSHMAVVDFSGKDAAVFLRYLLANSIDRLVIGKGLYSCLLNEHGGILDDLIVYKIRDDFFRVVVNAGTRQKDLAWFHLQLNTHADLQVEIHERTDLAMLAVQGPVVREKITQIFPKTLQGVIASLLPFHAVYEQVDNQEWFVARTGYTGEDGFEIVVPATIAVTCWEKVLAAGVLPCGLGARDTLRLEAGLNLYGADMDETVTPFEAGLAWTVALEPVAREFIGRAALENQKQQGVKYKLVGLVAEGRVVLRSHQKISAIAKDTFSDVCGEVTSGGFSPTLETSIALARVPITMEAECMVEVRGKTIPVRIVKPPFVKKGKKNF